MSIFTTAIAFPVASVSSVILEAGCAFRVCPCGGDYNLIGPPSAPTGLATATVRLAAGDSGRVNARRRLLAPPGCHKTSPQAALRALIWADRRLLWRAALFLWMIFLSAMRSMTDTES